jgi:SAM-dependent methyltransferase
LKLTHFDLLQPICPHCLAERGDESPLALSSVAARRADDIVEGSLTCTDRHCLLEYPIIDGIPLLLPDPRRFIADNLDRILVRSDLSPLSESIIGDYLGPQSLHHSTRQGLSTHTWDAYGEFDPAERSRAPVLPGGVVRCLRACLERVSEPAQATILDIGCSVGRSCFELAQTTDQLVLGIDVDLSALRMARSVLQRRRVSYPRRRIGIVYDRRDFAVNFPGMERVDFWACSGLSLPFRASSFGMITALRVLDAVTSPLALLNTISRALIEHAHACLATAYDWSAAVTPVEGWIGGHTPRASMAGAAEPLLRALLTPGAHPKSVAGLVLRHDIEHFAWHKRLHDRSATLYDMHLAIAQAVTGERSSAPQNG